MEEQKKLPVRVSKDFNVDLDIIFTYGVETFGLQRAEVYEGEIWKLIDGLSNNWSIFSECRHLPTKSKRYRWIILESHLIIYRITDTEIQVLRIVHSHRSVTKIKTSRSVRP